jgi:outer membrane scaffolding protein for murein synthesis (MipA/OmpV family)
MARFTKSVRLAIAAVALCALAAAAKAETPAEGNPILLPETGLTVDLGAAVRLRPDHLGSSSYTVDAVPLVDGQWGKDLHFSLDDGIQYTAIRWGRLKAGPDLEYRQSYNDHLPPRSTKTADAVEAGGFAKVDLTYAELDVRVRKALNGYEGVSGDISLDTLPKLAPKWYLGLEARLGWADRKFSRNAFAHTGVVSSHIGDYYSAGAQAALIYLWKPRTKIALSLSDDQILRPSRPLSGAQTRNAATLALAVTHRFSW